MSVFTREAVAQRALSVHREDIDSAGRSSPLGATVTTRGVNFSLYSRLASGVELLLFDREGDTRPARGDSTASAMKSVVVDPRGYDWEGAMPLQIIRLRG